MRHFSLIAALVLLAGLAFSQSFTIKGKVIYEGKAPVGRWKGENPSLEGQAVWNAQARTLRGRVCLDQAQWNSKEPLRDSHTRKMFEVDRFPKACLDLESLEGNVPGKVVVKGTMEIHGVKKRVEIPGDLRVQGQEMRFTGEWTTRITDWGMTPPSFMGMRVRNEVLIFIEVEAKP